jgi:hypothetical protein
MDVGGAVWGTGRASELHDSFMRIEELASMRDLGGAQGI